MPILDSNRLFHSEQVAKFMFANTHFPNKKEELYTLGLLHDIGYLFGNRDHNILGGNFLREQQYKYWKEVYYHGIPHPSYSSHILDELNWADLSVDSYGNNVGFEKRINNILERYGHESIQYLNALEMKKQLEEKGYYSLF